MPHRRLADFLEALEDQGQLVRVGAEVDSVLEVAAITRRVRSGDGPALFFERVKGHRIPVVTNLLGSGTRILRALEVDSLEIVEERVAAWVEPPTAEGWLDAIKLVPRYAFRGGLPPRVAKAGPCQQVVRLASDVDLAQLPLLRFRTDAAGPSLCHATLFTRCPESGVRHCGAYDFVVIGPREFALRCRPGDPAARDLLGHRRRGDPMPAAVSLGGLPIESMMATAAVPPEIDRCLFGGMLQNRALELVRCRTCELEVPSQAEVVIEGFIDPAAAEVEVGPVTTADGLSAASAKCPVLHVEAITQRSNPILALSVPGRPPSEVSIVRRMANRLLLPLLRAMVPELVDFDLPDFVGEGQVAYVSFRKSYPWQAQQIAGILWGLGPLSDAKVLLLLDENADVHDSKDVIYRVGAHVRPASDVFFQSCPVTAPQPSQNGLHHAKMAIDATAKLAEELGGDGPTEAEQDDEVTRLVVERWDEYGIEGQRPP